MAAKKKTALAKAPNKANLSGGSGNAAHGSDLKGGGSVTQPVAKKKK